MAQIIKLLEIKNLIKMKKLFLTIAILTINLGFSQGTINSFTSLTTGTVSGNSTQQDEVLIHDAATTLTLTMALPTTPVNGQMFSFTSASGVTTLTLSTSTGTIVNAITTLAVGGNATYIYLATPNKWYKIR